MKKSIWILPALAALGAGGLLRSQYERDHFVAEETKICSPRIKRERTAVFLTDLHDKEFGEGNRLLLDAVRQEQPDFVLIGGDTMVVKPGLAGLEATERLLAGLKELCPVYYGNGNHEQRLLKERESYGEMYRDFRRLLRKYQVVYLADSSVEVDEDIRISGLDISQAYYRDVIPKRMERNTSPPFGKGGSGAVSDSFGPLSFIFGCLRGMGGRILLWPDIPWGHRADPGAGGSDDASVSVFPSLLRRHLQEGRANHDCGTGAGNTLHQYPVLQ